MKSKLSAKISSFSLFEVTVALAILSILIGIIGTSINRLNEQVKISSHLSDDVNHFYTVRSALWRELYASDSIRVEQNTLLIYSNNEVVLYLINEDRLHKKSKDYVQDLKIEVSGIEKVIAGNQEKVQINFLIGDQAITMSYVLQTTIEQTVNTYFSTLQ
jgi:competence protein ComGF